MKTNYIANIYGTNNELQTRFSFENTIRFHYSFLFNKRDFKFFSINSPLEQFEILSLIYIIHTYFNLNMVEKPHFINLFYVFFPITKNVIEITFWILFVYTAWIIIFSKQINFFNFKNYFHTGCELVIRSIMNLIVTNGTLSQQSQLPFIFGFTFVLFTYNISGLFPFSFTFTAHIICTFFFSFSIFFGLNFIAIQRYGRLFFNIFIPAGTPFNLLFLIVFLEVVSYLSRPFSLAIRLFANMMAGHALLKILISFVFIGFIQGMFLFFMSLFGFSAVTFIVIMEFLVAFLQIFVFITLIMLYISDLHNVHSHLYLWNIFFYLLL